MQPRVIHLPDSLRDRLEQHLELSASIPREQHGVTIQESVLREQLYPKHIAPDERAFLRDLHESLLELTCGYGAPALLFNNLPPTKGLAFTQALSRLLGNGTLALFTPQEQMADAQTPHNDKSYPGITPGRRSIVAMHCVDPGTVAQPTVFVTADEVIDLWAKRLIAQGHDAADARATVIDVLSHTFCREGHEHFPLLARNPNYAVGCAAPEFILLSNQTDDVMNHLLPVSPSPLAADRLEMKNNLKAVLDEACAAAAPTSQASTKANTMTLYNDALILHGRGPSRNGRSSQGRHLIAHDAFPLAHYSDVASYATAGPHSQAAVARKFGIPFTGQKASR